MKHYTKNVFRQVQREIVRSVYSCSHYSVTNSDGVYEIVVLEYKNNQSSSRNVEVIQLDSDNDDQFDDLLNDAQFKVNFI